MAEKHKQRCTINDLNPFWLHYLSLEKSLKEISEYISITEDNYQSYSFKNMQLYFAVCTEIDSIFKHIRSNLNLKELDRLNIANHMEMLEKHFPEVKKTIVLLNMSGFDLQFQPFQVLSNNTKEKSRKITAEKAPIHEGWWKDYNAVKHQRPENFYRANLDNLLNSFAALHILNLVYAVSLDANLVSKYDEVLVQVDALRDYPFFQMKGSEVIRYAGGRGNFYGCYLNNKYVYSAD